MERTTTAHRWRLILLGLGVLAGVVLLRHVLRALGMQLLRTPFEFLVQRIGGRLVLTAGVLQLLVVGSIQFF